MTERHNGLKVRGGVAAWWEAMGINCVGVRSKEHGPAPKVAKTSVSGTVVQPREK